MLNWVPKYSIYTPTPILYHWTNKEILQILQQVNKQYITIFLLSNIVFVFRVEGYISIF